MAESIRLAIVISAAFRGGGAFDKAGGGLKGMIAGLKKVRAEIALFAAMAAFDFLKKGFNVMVQFEQRMAEAGSILGSTREEIEAFTAEIKEMSRSLPQTADELGAGLYDVFSAGVTESAAAMDTLELAAKAAVAGLTDTATSVKAGISTMNAFGLTVDDLTHIYDVQFLTVKRGIIRYGELSEVIGKIAPSAKAAGQSMEGMFGTLAFLTTKGMSAAEASTALGRAFDALTMPATVKKLREVGVSVADLTTELMQTDPVLVGLRSAISGADDELRRINQDVIVATNEYSSQNSELLKLESQYNETSAAMQDFSDELQGISITQRENRLEISKIRQQADREGRELTEGELARIDEISEANDELAITYEETALAQTKLSITAKEQEEAVNKQKIAVDVASSSLEGLTEHQISATKAVSDANDKYDEIVAQTGNFRPLVDIVADLNTEMAGMSEVARAQAIAEIFPQIRARKAIISIMGDTQTLKANIDEMTDSTQSAGAMQTAFATNLDTTANDLKIMTASVQELQIAISEDLLPIITAVMEVIKPLIRWLSENTKVIWLLVAAFIAYKVAMSISALIGLVTAAQAAYSASTIGATLATWGFNAALLANPITWIVIAIIALIAVLFLLWKHWDDVTAAVSIFADGVMGVLKDAWEWLVGALTSIGDVLGDVLNWFLELPGMIAQVFIDMANSAIQWGKDLIDNFIQGIIDAATGLGDVFGDIWDEMSGWISFDVRANDEELKKWGFDAISFFTKGIKESIPAVSIASEDVRATLNAGLVSSEAVGGAGSSVGSIGTGTTIQTNDTYEININVDKIEEGMDMGKFAGNLAEEIDKQKKTKGSVPNV